jgi:hypothetical protein
MSSFIIAQSIVNNGYNQRRILQKKRVAESERVRPYILKIWGKSTVIANIRNSVI